MKDAENDFSLYSLFVPLTNKKIIIIIFVIGFFVFFNMLFNNFVWDDRTFIQYNPDIRNLDIFYLLKANMFNNINAGQYRFLPALYFTFLYSLFSTNTFFYHFAQLAVHITNCLLVFFVLKRFFKKNLSFFLALIFLVHPIQVESVSYIASSGNPLFFFFGMSAFLINMKAKLSLRRDAAIFLLLLFSLFSKETGIFFIFLVILYRTIFAKNDRIRQIVLCVTTIGIYAYVRFVIAGVFFSTVKIAPIANAALPQRLLNIPAVIFYYLWTFVYPMRLSIEQYWLIKSFSFSDFLIPFFVDLIVLAFLFAFGSYIYKKKHTKFLIYLFFSIWFCVAFITYTQLFPLDMTVADRWFYFPLFGLLGIIGSAISFGPSFRIFRKKELLIAAILIFMLSVRTIARNANWHDPITLYSHDSTVKNNFDIENSLGGELNLVGQNRLAMVHFKKSVDMFAHETNLFNLALSYEQQSDLSSARKYYLMAYNSKSYGQVPYPHKHHDVTYLRLTLLLMQSDPRQALNVITNGVSDYPKSGALWYIKALTEYKLNNLANALASARNASHLLPNDLNVKNVYEKLLNNKGIDTILK